MRSTKLEKQRATTVTRRRPKKSLSGEPGLVAKRLTAAWTFLAKSRSKRLRLPAPLLNSIKRCLPSGNHPRSLYNLVAWFRPETRKCLVGILAGVVVLLAVWLFIFSSRGLLTRTTLDTMIAGSAAKNAAIAALNLELKDEIARLEGDPETIEALARNELNMAFPNESIYRPREEGPPAYVLNITPTRDVIR